MRTSNQQYKHLSVIIAKFIIAILLAIGTCYIFNFLLVPPTTLSKVGTIMTDLNTQNENVDVIFLGSSRTYRAFETPKLSEDLNKNVFNIAANSVSYCSLYHLLIEICKTNSPEHLLLEYSPANFKRNTGTDDKIIYQMLTGENKKQFKKAGNIKYNNLDIIDFTNYMNNFSNGQAFKNVEFKLGNDKKYASDTKYSKYTSNGFVFADKNIETEDDLTFPKSYYIDGEFWDKDHINIDALKYFNKIIDFCQKNNIKITLYSPPYPHFAIRDNLEGFEAFDKDFKEIINTNNLVVLDFGKLKRDYMSMDDQYFYNANHLNGIGAQTMTASVEVIYNELINGTLNLDNYFYDSFTSFHSAYTE